MTDAEERKSNLSSGNPFGGKDTADPIADIMPAKEGAPPKEEATKQTQQQPEPEREAKPEAKSSARSSSSTALIVDVSNKSTHFWVPDDAVSNCGLCKKGFSIFRRKHHCRMCGQIFCGGCSEGKVKLPKTYGWGEKKVRVCDTCKGNVQSEKAPQNPEEALMQRLSVGGEESSVPHSEHFKTLSIEPTSDISVIKKQYMKLAAKLHPDKAKAAGIHYDTTEEFNKVKNAYQALRKMLESGADGKEMAKKQSQRKDGTVKAGQKLERDDSGKVIHAKACSCCHRVFTLIRRRHTCRMCGSVVCQNCSPSKRAVEGFSVPERVCVNCTRVGDQAALNVGSVLMITDSVAELKGHDYLRQLKFEAHVEAIEGKGFVTVLSFAPEAAQVDESKMRNLRAHGISEIRTLEDYKWLREQLLFRMKPRHKIVPPLFPMKNKKSQFEQLKTFLNVVLKHILLHDDPIFQLFITMKKKDLDTLKLEPGTLKDITAWKRIPVLQLQVQVMNMFKCDGESWYKFKIEQHCCERITEEQQRREKRQQSRIDQHKERISVQAIRTEEYQNRMSAMESRKSTYETRTKERDSRIKIEQENKDRQRSTDKLVYIHRDEDAKSRTQAAKDVKDNREAYDADVAQHNKAVADQKRHLDTLVSVQTEWALDKQEYPNQVHKWLLNHMQAELPSPQPNMQLPDLVRKLIALRDEIPEASIRDTERLEELKSKYENESDLVVDEKETLQKEKEPIAVEAKNWEKEYKQIEHEKELIASERANRKKKEEVIETDVSKQEHMIEVRAKTQAGRMDIQVARKDEQNARKKKHELEIAEERKRVTEQKEWEDKLKEAIKFENERLKRQRTDTHVLRFDHSLSETLLTNVKQGLEAHKKALKECKALTVEHFEINKAELRKGKQERTEADADLLRMKEGQGRRTIHEIEDGTYDERDSFAIEIHKRRMRNETSLATEEKGLADERKRLDQEVGRIGEEEKTLKLMKTENTAEEVSIVAMYDLIDQLETAIREDETSRATKMKEYLSFVNGIVAKQTERLMRYKDIQQVQQTRTKACGDRLQESKASMAKLIDMDEASGARLERAEKRSDKMERQRGEQTQVEERLFFDNMKEAEEKAKDVKECQTASGSLDQINKFVQSLRPAMNLGMKEKSEQVRILQNTWKASKSDHTALNNFTKKYPKESVSLSGMDNIPDHDNEFAHTLRTPYELAFKQDEMESKDYFHPISAALLKEGDTFAMLRSSQDDLTVWIQKLRDSVRDENTMRKQEDEHLQAQLKKRLEKERKINASHSKINREVEEIVVEYQRLQTEMKNFEKNLEASSFEKKRKETETENSEANRIKTDGASRHVDVKSLNESQAPDEKDVNANEKDLSRVNSLYSKYTHEASAIRAKKESTEEKHKKLQAVVEEYTAKAGDDLKELKQKVCTPGSNEKPHEQDEFMITHRKAVSDLSQRVSNYIGKMQSLTSVASDLSVVLKKWQTSCNRLAEQQEEVAESCKRIASELKAVESTMGEKREAHSRWRKAYVDKLEELKRKVTASVARSSKTTESANEVEKLCDLSAMEEHLKKGQSIIDDIKNKGSHRNPDSSLLTEKYEFQKLMRETKAALDDVRVAYVGFNRKATADVDAGSKKLEQSLNSLRKLSTELKEKDILEKLNSEAEDIPKHSAWDNDLTKMSSQINASIKKLDGISTTSLEDRRSKFEELLKSVQSLTSQVKTEYEDFKSAIDAACGSLKTKIEAMG
eukprot:CAMPEP_0114498418 /NCGR_PEP_ID=MMETSP0109-20121206/6866_1 /TAXON_ID=29199 /ORGANISM="Chlorarachnion reptans, Strain CCCM449" /LENGTH=1735 /DNA_ID=CAMNT_0001675903 /DNA_START=52 /DNA_END=5259 /DNA_ORIENTATION=-